MENHLFEKHSYDMLEKLQIEYSDNEDRIQYAMELIKQQSKAAGNANDDNKDESTAATTKGNNKE
jgi:Tfp pilus assembly protein PilW